MLRKSILESLVSAKSLARNRSAHDPSVQAAAFNRLYESDRIAFKSLVVHRPMFVESDAWNLLGIDFLAKFVVTFDFPRQRLYLRALASPENFITDTGVAVVPDGLLDGLHPIVAEILRR